MNRISVLAHPQLLITQSYVIYLYAVHLDLEISNTCYGWDLRFRVRFCS